MFDSFPVCRVCLKESLEYIDFDTPFEVDANIKATIDNGLTYLDCFQACTRIEVDLDENYPQSLCSSCGLELKIAYEFIQKAEYAEKTLKRISSNTKVEKFDGEDEMKYFIQSEFHPQNDEDEDDNCKPDALVDENQGEEIEKTFVCSVCGEQFFSQMVLNLHVNRLHSNSTNSEAIEGVEKVECQICDIILSIDNLEAHMQLHEEESNVDENNENNEKTIFEEEIPEDVDGTDSVEFEVLDMSHINAEDENEEEEITDPNDAQTQLQNQSTELDENYEHIDMDDEDTSLHSVEDESVNDAKCDEIDDEDEDEDVEFKVIAKMIGQQEKQKQKTRRPQYQECEVCNKQVRLSAFTAHMNVHKGIKQFECEHCFQAYFSKRSLLKHVRVTHADLLNSTCRICKEKIETTEMKTHIDEKHSHSVKCEKCDHECPEHKLNDHMKRKHWESKDFLCNVCSKTFRSLGILNAHLKYHNKKTFHIKSDACSICGKVFSSNHYLKSHMSTHRENRVLLKCEYCDKVYHTKNSLINHRRIHTGDTIKCMLCDKEFGRQYELNVHMRFHTKEYPFECEICKKKFAIKGHLRTHMWRHQGLKLQCEECGKLFTSTKALAEHSFYHSEMPYQCPYCPKAYPSKPKFKVHLKTAHMVEFSNEELDKMVKFPIPKKPRNRKFLLVQADTVSKEIEVHTKDDVDED